MKYLTIGILFAVSVANFSCNIDLEDIEIGPTTDIDRDFDPTPGAGFNPRELSDECRNNPSPDTSGERPGIDLDNDGREDFTFVLDTLAGRERINNEVVPFGILRIRLMPLGISNYYLGLHGCIGYPQLQIGDTIRAEYPLARPNCLIDWNSFPHGPFVSGTSGPFTAILAAECDEGQWQEHWTSLNSSAATFIVGLRVGKPVHGLGYTIGWVELATDLQTGAITVLRKEAIHNADMIIIE